MKSNTATQQKSSDSIQIPRELFDRLQFVFNYLPNTRIGNRDQGFGTTYELAKDLDAVKDGILSR